MAHTPGPWTIESDAEMIHIHSDLRPTFTLRPHIDLDGHEPICSCGSVEDSEELRTQNEVNMALVAAAPDLLRALKACLMDMEECYYGEEHEEQIDAACKAIAKAMGQA